MDNNLAARVVQAVRNPETIAPRNGHKESDDEWAARVVGYVLADAEPSLDDPNYEAEMTLRAMQADRRRY